MPAAQPNRPAPAALEELEPQRLNWSTLAHNALYLLFLIPAVLVCLTCIAVEELRDSRGWFRFRLH